MNHLALINPENVSEEEVQSYPVREAARAIVMDAQGKIALLHVTKRNYYKLPGGGLEGSENHEDALKRECLEEIGCDIEVVGEIGSIVEYRKMFNLKQTSYCYLAKLKGEKGTPTLMEDEKEDGFETVWLSYDDAVQNLISSKPTIIKASGYMVPRDTVFLKEAKQFLHKI